MAISHDEILLRKLQETIVNWSTEVTGAHDDLTQQIRDAKAQLVTLSKIIEVQQEAAGQSGASDTQQAFIPMLKRKLEQARDELRKLQGQNEAMAQDIQRYKYNERVNGSAQEIQKKELEDLKARLGSSQTEQQNFQQKLDGLKAERDEAQKEVASLTAIVTNIEGDQGIRLPASTADALELIADLKTVELELEVRGDEIAVQRDQIDLEIERNDNKVQIIDELATDVTRLNMEIDDLGREHSALRQDYDAAQQELRTFDQAEHNLKNELRTLSHEYERQSQTLQETIKELETYWGRAEKSRESDDQLQTQATELNAQLQQQASHINELEEELRSTQSRHDQEQQAHNLEMENLRVEKQQEMYKFLNDLEEKDFSKDDIQTARKIQQQNERIKNLESENAELAEHLSSAQVRLTELTATPDVSNEAASVASDEIYLLELKADLETFDAYLTEREEALRDAAVNMANLEEAARALQNEMIALRDEQEAALNAATESRELAEAQQEIESLREVVLKANAKLDALAVERDEAIAGAESMPKLVENARLEIEQLKTTLYEQNVEIEKLKSAAMVTGESSPTEDEQAFTARDEEGHRRNMGEILVEADIITRKQLESALEEQRTAKKRRLGSILVEKGFVREEMVAQVVASQLDLPFVRLAEEKIERGATVLMDGRLATHHMCFPLRATTEKIIVAMANPLDLIALEDLEFATSLKVAPVVATLSDITSAIVEYYGVTIANAIEDNFENQTPPKTAPKMTDTSQG